MLLLAQCVHKHLLLTVEGEERPDMKQTEVRERERGYMQPKTSLRDRISKGSASGLLDLSTRGQIPQDRC